MDFEISIFINCQPEICFTFLRDKDTYPQKPDSPVLALDKITPGPVRIGTRYVEVVRMFPLIKGEIRSVVTRFEPPEWLGEDFEGAGMKGHLTYQFIHEGDGTRLIQREWLQMKGVLRLFEPLVRQMLGPKLQQRLVDIKEILEAGWGG
jgi:hypothetical protein